MAWQHRLPDGVRHEGSSSQGFTLSVSLPVGEDGFAPLQCPADADHRFKVTLTQRASGQSSNCYCPYCGTRAPTDEFLADQLPRLDVAMEAAAEQYAHQALNDILSKAFGKPTGPRNRSGLFDVTVSYQPGRPPPRRVLPSYDIEGVRDALQGGPTAQGSPFRTAFTPATIDHAEDARPQGRSCDPTTDPRHMFAT